jgi:predicted PurR-regulated permease PerM
VWAFGLLRFKDEVRFALVKLSFQKLFYVLVFIFGLFAVMVLAKPVLIPLSLALFISFILLPVVKKLEAGA